MKHYRKYLKPRKIDVVIVAINRDSIKPVPAPDYNISVIDLPNERRAYEIYDGQKFVHRTVFFKNVRLLKLINQSGPVVGDGITVPEYRGRSILPFVLDRIAREAFQNGNEYVFGVINSNNTSSLRAVDKLGFKIFAKIKATRFLFWYFNTHIQKNFPG